MRTARLAALTLAAALAGCGPTTFPWTSGSGPSGGSGGGGGATLSVSPTSLTFTAIQGAAAPASQAVTLSVQGSVPPTLYVRVSQSGAVSAATFSDVTGTVTVSVGAPSTVGTTTGEVTIHVYSDSAGTQDIGGSPKSVAVTYRVDPAPVPGTFSVSPTSLSFSALQGDPAPTSKDLTVTTQAGSSGAVYLSAQMSGIAGATAVLDTTVSPALVHVTMPAPGGTSTSGTVYVHAWEDAAHLKALPGSPKGIPVTYTVTPSQLAASPTSLTFGGPSGVAPGPQDVSLSDAIGSASWSSSVWYQNGSGWLTVTPSSGSSLPATATVSISPLTYATTYRATITFSARGVTSTVGVTYTVTAPKVVATPTSLAFSSISGQTTPIASKTLALAADNGASLAYTTSVTYGGGTSGWLTVPAGGTSPETISVGIGGPPLAVGRYAATVQISGPYGSAPTSVPVTYDVLAPDLNVSSASQSFFVDQYTTVANTSQSLVLSDAGTPISWSATVDAPWLQVAPSSGTTGTTYPRTELVLPELETISQGSHAATVVLTYVATSGATVQVRVPVTLTVNLAYVDFVSPRVSVEGIGGDVLLRGRGFQYPFSIRFGTTDATWAYGSTTTQVKATPPALSAGSYAVTSANNLGLTRSRAQLDVVAPVTRALASVTSAGKKTKAIFDDVRKALYVANVGLGKVQRHREAAAWVVDPAVDEIALTGLKNIALSTDGKTILAIAGYSLKTIDAATFALTAAQPAATIPSYVSSTAAFDVEYLNDGRAIFVDKPSGSVGDVRIYDPATDTISYPNLILRPPGLAIAKDGSRAVVFGGQTSYPPQSVSYYDANASAVTTTAAQQDASLGAVDRHGTRTLLCGVDALAWRSVLYDASFAVLPGGVPSTTAAVALSSIGLGRAYTWDGTRVHAFSIEGPVTAGLWDDAFKPGVAPKATPGTNAVLALSADERTAFVAGDSAIEVVPLPP